jgi:NAD(P)-dependent dehydrogenase (short-subunit alcohol dehydrogenase family)
MNDGGSIVITSSVAATRGDPGVYAYITAKHAQIGLMRCLAKELAPRQIRVNTIHPGRSTIRSSTMSRPASPRPSAATARPSSTS